MHVHGIFTCILQGQSTDALTKGPHGRFTEGGSNRIGPFDVVDLFKRGRVLADPRALEEYARRHENDAGDAIRI